MDRENEHGPWLNGEREVRALLGMYLRRTALPADRPRLVDEARHNHAPDKVVRMLRELPQGHRFRTVAEVWDAIEAKSRTGRQGSPPWRVPAPATPAVPRAANIVDKPQLGRADRP
jgi:hypothetical protein